MWLLLSILTRKTGSELGNPQKLNSILMAFSINPKNPYKPQ